MSRERGSVAILMTAVVVFAALACLGMARLGRAATDRSRADTAADAAALAAAEVLADGGNRSAALRAARRIAAANGAVLDRFRATGERADVEVNRGAAHAHARAEIDW
jgi:Flp pilus assembly protein TadG